MQVRGATTVRAVRKWINIRREHMRQWRLLHNGQPLREAARDDESLNAKKKDVLKVKELVKAQQDRSKDREGKRQAREQRRVAREARWAAREQRRIERAGEATQEEAKPLEILEPSRDI